MKKNFKKILSLFLVFLMLFTTFAFADGDGNITGGGGGDLVDADDPSHNVWHGEEGVRVSITNAQGRLLAGPIDYSNNLVNADGMNHFIKKTKMQLESDHTLTLAPSGEIYRAKPLPGMPKIIKGDPVATKAFFVKDGTVQSICKDLNYSYEEVINDEKGDHKIVIEPIAYFLYCGYRVAMTATEAAVFNKYYEKGHLRSNMGNLTNEWLPLSLFLERDDMEMGILAYKGSTTGMKDDIDIMLYLGIGIIKFKDFAEEPIKPPPPPPPVKLSDYNTDIDVYTRLKVTNVGGDIDGTEFYTRNVKYTFSNGTKVLKQQNGGRLLIPKDKTATDWVKWHTPKNEGSVTISAEAIDPETGVADPNIQFEPKKVTFTNVHLEEPQNPRARDTSMDEPFAGGKRKWHTDQLFKTADIDLNNPHVKNKSHSSSQTHADPITVSNSWEEYITTSCKVTSEYIQVLDAKVEIERTLWNKLHKEDGEPFPYKRSDIESWLTKDERRAMPRKYKTEYDISRKSATLLGRFKTKKGYRSSRTYNDKVVLKAGYGIDAIYEPTKQGYEMTNPQTVWCAFPEYNWNNRMNVGKWMEYVPRDNNYQFVINKYSQWHDEPDDIGNRTHFTPFWYPDKERYGIVLNAMDCWSPGGQLKTFAYDNHIIIDGSCYDDWQTHLVEDEAHLYSWYTGP